MPTRLGIDVSRGACRIVELDRAGADGSTGSLGTILYGSDRKLAIVDGRIVQVGDDVRGARVIDILSDAVLFRDVQGWLRKLSLRDSRR